MNQAKRKLRAIRKAAERRLVRLQDKMFAAKGEREAARLKPRRVLEVGKDGRTRPWWNAVIKRARLRRQRGH